jgi:hypothetical protein
MPRLKSLDLVSSISTKFDDQISKTKVHEDLHIDQANTIELEDEKVHLKIHKKNHELHVENKGQWQMEPKSHGGFSENSSPLRRIQNNAICESTLKLRPSSAPQQMLLSKSKEGKNMDGFGFSSNSKDEINAIGTYRSRGVKGVKEDCERFRLQMKILKEKAHDSRIREVMVEGMVENLHNNVNKEAIKVSTIGDANDIVDIDEKRQKSILVFKNLLSATDNLNIEGNITTNIDNIDGKFNQHNEKKNLLQQ